MDEQEFVSLLQALQQPDTNKVKTTTSQLNNGYYKSPQSVVALIHIITSHPEPSLRQLAAVEARKRRHGLFEQSSVHAPAWPTET